MKPQARIKARIVEDVAAAGIKVAVRARKSQARIFTHWLVDGHSYYLHVVGGSFTPGRQFIEQFFPHASMTSGGGGSWTFSLPPEDVRRLLDETELDPEFLKSKHSPAFRIARSIRDERAFAQLPVLADALEESGCANTFILDHCRQAVAHKDTCWVVELLVAAYKTG